MATASTLVFRQIGMAEKELAKALFRSVFTIEPWNDDWSDPVQLDLYLTDLMGQSNSLTYGLFEDEQLIGLSMGRVKHWFSGTEYSIDEFCIRTDRQGLGLGTIFLRKIENAAREAGLTHLFLQTEKTVPAYDFYLKNGFHALTDNAAFAKRI